MNIILIDDNNLLMKNDIKLNANIYDSIIDELFHIIHIFPNVIMLISTSKSVRALAHSNIFSNMYIKMTIEQLLYYKAMKFKILSMHVIYMHPKQFGIFLSSNCIIDLQQFSVYKFTFPMNRP